jgi:hypothetical protein
MSLKNLPQSQKPQRRIDKFECAPLHRKIGLLLFLLSLSLLLLSGCLKNNPKGGGVFVGQPQVLSRESTIRERQREKEWLKDQLAVMPEESWQGFIETELIKSFSAGISAKFDPLGGAVQDELSKLAVDETKLNRDKIGYQRELLEQRYKNELAMLSAPDGPGFSTNGSDQTQPESASVAELRQKYTELEEANAKRSAELEERLKQLEAGSGTPDNFADRRAKESRAALTPGERLQDLMAYRAQINSALRDKHLSETHDLAGRKHYDLNFGVTFVPPKNNNLFAVVTMRLKDDGTHVLDEKDIGPMEASLIKRIYREYELAENQLLVTCGDLGRIHDRNLLYDWSNVMNFNEEMQKKDIKEEYVVRPLYNPFEGGLSGNAAMQICPQANNAELEKFLELLPARFAFRYRCLNYFSPFSQKIQIFAGRFPGFKEQLVTACDRLPEHFEEKNSGESNTGEELEKTFFSFSINIDDAAFNHINAKVKNKTDMLITRVEPSTYAQNLSSVSARQSTLALAADILALLGSGVSAGANAAYSRTTRQFLEAVKRQPLAMGFTNGNKEFGWVLGPRFEISNKGKAKFSHTPVHHILSASLLAPAWAKNASFVVETAWVDSDGNLVNVQNATMVDNGKTVQTQIDVKLAPDYDGLWDAYMEHEEGFARRPHILYRGDTFALRAGVENQRLYIPGANLWRNPEVYIDNAKASSVEIAPNMAGIYAVFKEALPEAADGKASLKVVTSTGDHHLSDVVMMRPAPKAGKLESFARPAKHWTVKASGNKPTILCDFLLDPRAMPERLPRLEGFAWRSGLKSKRNTIKPTNMGGNRFQLALAKVDGTLFPAGVKAQPVLVDLVAPLNDDDVNPQSVVQGSKNVVIFAEEAETKLLMKAARFTFKKDRLDTKKVALSLPKGVSTDVYYLAFPALKERRDWKLRLTGKNGAVLLLELDEASSIPEGKYVFRMPSALENENALARLAGASPYTPTTIEHGSERVSVSGKAKLIIQERK